MDLFNVPVDGDFSPRSLDSPKIFVLEIGKDGFNAYIYHPTEPSMEVFAASRSTIDFLKVVGTIYNSNGNGAALEFSAVERAGANPTPGGKY